MACEVRSTDEFRFGWGRERFMTMFSEDELRQGHVGALHPRGAMLHLLNKQVAVYFETSASRPGYEDRMLGRYITHLWYHMHAGRPPLQRHHYFDKAICFGERSFFWVRHPGPTAQIFRALHPVVPQRALQLSVRSSGRPRQLRTL